MNNQNTLVLLKRLPEGEELTNTECGRAFEQCIDYAEQVSPIKAANKMFLECASGGSRVEEKRNIIYTALFWKQLINYFDIPYNYEQMFIQKLKNFITEPSMMSFLGGRRAYPILEMLDKPRLQVEAKHLEAVGYFISFLTDKKVSIQEEMYDWSEATGEEVLYFNLSKK